MVTKQVMEHDPYCDCRDVRADALVHIKDDQVGLAGVKSLRRKVGGTD